jgi:cytochrome c peroxidase
LKPCPESPRLPALLTCALAGAFLLAGCIGGSEESGQATRPLALSAPGFPAMPIPQDNPTTEEGVALGRRLFHDPILSGDSTQSCASCHAPSHAFTDHGLRFSIGIRGDTGDMNASALVNPGWNTRNFWNGRAATLEEQALQPVVNPVEMAGDWATAAERLRKHPRYPALFGMAFGTEEIDSTHVVKALAQFQRTLISARSRYDAFRAGDPALSPSEFRGLNLFFSEAGDCFHCHVDVTFTDQDFHNNGIDSLIPPGSGLAAVTGDPLDEGKWKTPTLRNVEFSAPYMHDGRFATLEEVVEHYASGGHDSPTLDPILLKMRGRTAPLSDQDKADLVAFMKALSDTAFLRNPDFLAP